MRYWERLEDRNPMVAETRIRTLRFLGSSSRTAVLIVGGIVLSIMVILLALGARFVQFYSIELYVFMAPAIAIFAGVGTTAMGIAREREKRSMDILLTTPVTARQIVWGKFSACLLPVTLLSLLCFLLASGQSLIRLANGSGAFAIDGQVLPLWVILLGSFAITLAAGYSAAMVSIWVSSFMKRGAPALIFAFTTMVLLLMVIPGMLVLLESAVRAGIASRSTTPEFTLGFLFFTQPFFAMTGLSLADSRPIDGLPLAQPLLMLLNPVLMILLTWPLMFWAEKRVLADMRMGGSDA